MSEGKGSLGVVRAPIDDEHPLTSGYNSLPWKDVEKKFLIPASDTQHEDRSLLEAVVTPVQNVVEKVLRER